MTDLNTFRILSAVGESSSFATAARALGVTRSAVAKAIGRLEQQTGTRLFHRTTRSVALTHEGEALYARATETIRELDTALEEMAGRRKEPSGQLRICVPDAYGRSKMMPVLAKFLIEWPRLEADVTFLERPVDVVGEGFDFALQPGDFPASQGLITRVLTHHRISFCASPAYLEKHGKPETADDLMKHNCLQLTQSSTARPWTAKADDGQLRTFQPHSRARFNSCTAVRDAAVAGLGILQMPDYLVDQDLAVDRLRRVLVQAEPAPVPIVALYPTKKHLASKVRLFLDALVVADGPKRQP